MEIKARATEQLSFRDGVSKNGNKWEVTTFLFKEDKENYPQTFTADVWSAAMAQWLRDHLGESVTVSFDMNAREYNGRWYDSHKVFKLTRGGKDVLSTEPVKQADDYFSAPPVPPAPPEDDGLPF